MNCPDDGAVAERARRDREIVVAGLRSWPFTQQDDRPAMRPLVLCHVRFTNGQTKDIRRWCAAHSGEFPDIPGTYIVDTDDVPMWETELAGSPEVERWAWLPWDVPAGLPEEVTKKETARRMIALAFSKRVHRLDLLKLVEHALDQREFKALAKNLRAYVSAFENRDVSNDSELGMVTGRVEEIVNGFADETQRKAVVEKLRRVKRQLKALG